jgi:tetratricopeptide (TPR) repeat protein
VAEPTICSACGAKFKAHRNRCPRCRARVVVVDPAAVAAHSRRLKIVGATLTALALAGVGGVWLVAPKASSLMPMRSTVDPLAGRRPVPPPPIAEPKSSSRVRPFMDASGAAYESYQGGDFESALKQYQEAVLRNPQDAEALSNLGQVLVRLGRAVDALPYFDRAIELNPDRWAYQFNRARAEGLLGHWPECIAGYRRAQQLFPEDYATAFNLAVALHKSGDEEAAIVEYQKAIELAPEDGTFRRALGISLERLNRKAEAAAAYAEYLRLSPHAANAEKVAERIAFLTDPSAGSAKAPKPAELR